MVGRLVSPNEGNASNSQRQFRPAVHPTPISPVLRSQLPRVSYRTAARKKCTGGGMALRVYRLPLWQVLCDGLQRDSSPT
jgi:hypothetical protein